MLTGDDDFTSLAEHEVMNRGRVTSYFPGYHTGHTMKVTEGSTFPGGKDMEQSTSALETWQLGLLGVSLPIT